MTKLITGPNGFVGNKLIQTLEGAIPSPSLRGLSEDAINKLVSESNATAIIHTAAISIMGTCEADPDASYNANVLTPIYLAKACKANNIKLVCFSSDQVYNGSKTEGPYKEGDELPNNTYAKHKLEMENRVLDILPSAVMLRAEWMYDHVKTKPDYFSIVSNSSTPLTFSSKEYRAITYVKEVAENMESVIKLPGGAYNFGSETDISIYEITCRFIEYLGKTTEVLDKEPGHNLWMDCSKAREHGVIFSSAIDGLIRCSRDA